MKRIWAPWRLEYIVGDKPDGCIFCEKADATNDQDDLVLYRGKYCYIMMNRYPYNNGHLMVVSKDHIDLPTKLPVEAQTELMQQINMCLEVLQEAMQPNGFNVGINLGTCAGAGIKDHLHICTCMLFLAGRVTPTLCPCSATHTSSWNLLRAATTS